MQSDIQSILAKRRFFFCAKRPERFSFMISVPLRKSTLSNHF